MSSIPSTSTSGPPLIPFPPPNLKDNAPLPAPSPSASSAPPLIPFPPPNLKDAPVPAPSPSASSAGKALPSSSLSASLLHPPPPPPPPASRGHQHLPGQQQQQDYYRQQQQYHQHQNYHGHHGYTPSPPLPPTALPNPFSLPPPPVAAAMASRHHESYPPPSLHQHRPHQYPLDHRQLPPLHPPHRRSLSPPPPGALPPPPRSRCDCPDCGERRRSPPPPPPRRREEDERRRGSRSSSMGMEERHRHHHHHHHNHHRGRHEDEGRRSRREGSWEREHQHRYRMEHRHHRPERDLHEGRRRSPPPAGVAPGPSRLPPAPPQQARQRPPAQASEAGPTKVQQVHHQQQQQPRPSHQLPRPPVRKGGINFTKEKFNQHKEFLEKRAEMGTAEILEQERKVWTRSAPADLYYQRDLQKPLMMRATEKLRGLCDRFEEVCINPGREAAKQFPDYEPPKIKRLLRKCKGTSCAGGNCYDDDSSDSSSSSSDNEDGGEDDVKKETAKDEAVRWLKHRQQQSYRLHQELWENQPGELNDGPACRCSAKARKIGIRHGIYQGETKVEPPLDPSTNNSERLHHYRVTISPPTNFLIKNPTVVHHDGHDFVFEGFSLFTTEPLGELPTCKVLRFNIRYEILYLEEKVPDNFTVRELKLFHEYFFKGLLELVDWETNDRFLFMPRFVRDLSEDGKEILSMNEVLRYLISARAPLVDALELPALLQMSEAEWLDFIDGAKGMVVTKPGFKPAGVRLDQLDRRQDSTSVIRFPDVVHFGHRPAQLYYAGNSEYQRAWREYVKFRHLLANMAKPSYNDRRKLEAMAKKLVTYRSNSDMRREVTVAVSSQDFEKTGLMADIAQHGLLLPVLVNHLRLHASLDHFEARINYRFKNRHLLQLAVTHPSYKENYGTTPDHARNALSNCGIRQPEYGDRKVHFASSRKRGINVLISIMSRFGRKFETESNVQHNERLEFLGDAVVEFVASVHLFHMFPDLEEGGLATFRAALVQNQHLAILAETLGLEKYMLYAHGSDLCHDAELRHAMANCFEAVMGAVFLDGGIEVADRIFAEALFGADPDLHHTWTNLAHHPLQLQEPNGDRHWISGFPVLQRLTKFEDATGVEFTHIRLLARAFTDRSLGDSDLTMGSNQRMEFLGDTVLQLITSDYLYRHFPEHHEGHLSLLRSSVVNNRTQSVVCDDLGIADFACFANPKLDLKVKDKADLLEAYIGALYVDKDLAYCKTFAEVCFFPRLRHFILNQEWNDPKSKLQQCCLTLRQMNGKEPDIPVYKVTECKGPTNTRVYGVVVYFRAERLAKAQGQSIQEAEMNAARKALNDCSHLFPHLDYQKAIVEKSFQRQGLEVVKEKERENVLRMRKELGLDKAMEEKEKMWKEKLEGLSKEERIRVLMAEKTKRDEDEKKAELEKGKREETRKDRELREFTERRERRRKRFLEQLEQDRKEWLRKKEGEKRQAEGRREDFERRRDPTYNEKEPSPREEGRGREDPDGMRRATSHEGDLRREEAGPRRRATTTATSSEDQCERKRGDAVYYGKRRAPSHEEEEESSRARRERRDPLDPGRKAPRREGELPRRERPTREDLDVTGRANRDPERTERPKREATPKLSSLLSSPSASSASASASTPPKKQRKMTSDEPKEEGECSDDDDDDEGDRC